MYGYHFARHKFELKDDRVAVAAESGALSRILDFEFVSGTFWPCNQ
jgi:hypothetical protein